MPKIELSDAVLSQIVVKIERKIEVKFLKFSRTKLSGGGEQALVKKQGGQSIGGDGQDFCHLGGPQSWGKNPVQKYHESGKAASFKVSMNAALGTLLILK